MASIAPESLELVSGGKTSLPRRPTLNRIHRTRRSRIICETLANLCLRRERPETNETGTLLPPKSLEHADKNTLILDLDETLIYATSERPLRYEYTVFTSEEGQIRTIYVQTRPGLAEFMETVREMYELVLFTAADRSYAEPIINAIPSLKTIPLRLYRQHCRRNFGQFEKDLSLLGRDLSKVVVLDNTPAVYSKHLRNVLQVSTWTGDRDDLILSLVLSVLRNLSGVFDVPESLEKENDLLLKKATSLGSNW